uniref:Protein translocase subunit SecA n=1 Tax=Kumanoa americana TaxID=1196377 RepID=A0A1C9CGM6_9FLOR|nr:preprotein translocase subunit SecA [Kumanoa americana]AOM67524.1 preprotein translocase subunit SecA [Kumanoa americana]
MFNFLSIQNHTTRIPKKYQQKINEINKLSDSMQNWSHSDLKQQTEILKNSFQKNQSLNLLLPMAYALVKETCRRILGLTLFDVQILCGIILHEGKIAEMKTGEGKTIVAALPAYLNALTQKGVHIVTVNDYLAKRDAEWIGKIHKYLGLNVGLIQQKMLASERQKNYMHDITYVTNSELGFDYLRDNMAIDSKDIVQKKSFNFCIIDEVDSILIDEARTPLIISGSTQNSVDKYKQANELSLILDKNVHYEIDEKAKNITLTDKGIIFCERFLKIDNIYQVNDPWAQYLLNALKAKELFLENQNYIIKNNEIIIVDEFTGRIMPGRRWSDGLHQAIEAKEKVKIQNENQTLASITYQNFFLLYQKLSGMTGTANTEAKEFEKIYELQVVIIPTNQKCIRKDLPDLVYKKEYNKWIAIANECYDMYQIGRPTLIGTTNVEKSELLAKILDQYKLPYNLLNARPENVERESEIIAQAGRPKTLTIATNMAGRGTDILLGGNAKYSAKETLLTYIAQYSNNKSINVVQNNQNQSLTILSQLNNYLDKNKSQIKLDLNIIKKYLEKDIEIKPSKNIEISIVQEVYEQLINYYGVIFAQDKQNIIALGGLHVIGTERHESRRIDNQLRGRAGRQGDPGSSRFFLSLEDNLLRIFGGEKILNLMETLNINDDTPIESPILNRSLNNAQQKVEIYYYDIRKQLFEYDEVLNNQRQAIYAERNRILHSNYIRDCIIEYGENTIDEILTFYCKNINATTLKIIENKIGTLLNIPEDLSLEYLHTYDIIQIKLFLYEQFRITYDLREAYLEQLKPGLIRQLEKYYLLQQIDKAWQEHLDKMTGLRDSIGWRSYGQQDPLIEYKNEAFSLFINMIIYIRETVVYLIMRSRLVLTVENKT